LRGLVAVCDQILDKVQ